MEKQATKHNKYYYEKGRNGWTPTTTEDVLDYKEKKVPDYYVGKVYKYEARKVIEDFDLTYNLGTATSYILRCSRKHDNAIDCIQKAINHLEFELDAIKNKND